MVHFTRPESGSLPLLLLLLCCRANAARTASPSGIHRKLLQILGDNHKGVVGNPIGSLVCNRTAGRWRWQWLQRWRAPHRLRTWRLQRRCAA